MTATLSHPATPAPAIALGGRKATVIRSIGLLGIIGGLLLILVGGSVWVMVSSQLSAEKITVSEDSSFLAGAKVDGPFTAYAQATIINHHALTMAEGKTYAELAKDDPIRTTVMDASFLRASLFTSVVSYGVAVFAIGIGVLVGAFGWVIRTLVPSRKTIA
ncbi:aromatic ring-opening dioxygenase LigA [Glaciihabitans sp. dw_435]|uniref:aromatic ring-opening dioxygenase LigA n=1 Tax=Glaciihabitans sp. dw_435 TaxID=2720081 RepID=UPI0021026146|nr:aromatic ring-opening dioxygenase LigA [Glaciihabitans sp. dw_435]